MKKMKKLFAVLLTLAMVLGMSATAFATTVDNSDGEQTGSPKATIIGVVDEEGVEVVAYQIIKYNSDGYYEEVLSDTIDKTNPTNGEKPQLTPSAENVQNLYYNKMSELKAIPNGSVTFTKQEDGTYTYDNLGLGSWLVVVNGAKNTLYNPAIISVNQGTNGKEYGTLNLNTKTWNETEQLYVKKDEPKITKTAEPTRDDPKDLDVAGTQYGDILKFTVVADIPSYTADKKDIIYTISDTLTGLDFVVDDSHPVVAKLGDANNEYLTGLVTTAINSAIAAKAKKFTVTVNDNNFLVTNGGGKITIIYYAKVTSTELINVDKLNNKAELEYSNNSSTGTTKKDVETKHYTFGIDTTVTGWTDSESTNKTGEFVKIDDQGNIQYSETPGEVIKKDGNPQFLSGAEFELRIGNENGVPFTDKQNKSTFTTDASGRLEIVGLDDDVDYYLVETKAPEGYTLNTKPIKVHITATYSEDDTLTSYDVEIGGAITHYNYTYESGKTELVNTSETASNPFGFKNTKLTDLPSTGGIGTTIFTVVGCLIMIAAAGMFFISRRKAVK